MLITRAPRRTDQRIACASAFGCTDQSGLTTFAISSFAEGASPAIPRLLSIVAAISPATKVPCPCVSLTEPPTKLFVAAIRPASSGCERSMPVSITATRTGASSGSTLNASNA